MKTPIESKPLRKIINTTVSRFIDAVQRTAKVIQHRDVDVELEVVAKVEVDAEYDFDQEKLVEYLADIGVANLPIEGVPVSAKAGLEREEGIERAGEGPFRSLFYLRARMKPRETKRRRV